ncbi:hypothetical protein GOP47_0030778, partial [Adiantum capillus-veneris]
MGLHGKCCLAEEESTLTPHHTPSQSFDFIVWEKAHLDSISADSASSCNSSTFSPSSSISKENPQSHHAESGPCLCIPPEYRNDSTHSQCTCLHPSYTCPPASDVALLACKPDADLPPCFLDHKLRLSDGESAEISYHCSCDRCIWTKFERLTSLEEAVCRSFAKGRTNWQKRNRLFSAMDDVGSLQEQDIYPALEKSHVEHRQEQTSVIRSSVNAEHEDDVEANSSRT